MEWLETGAKLYSRNFFFGHLVNMNHLITLTTNDQSRIILPHPAPPLQGLRIPEQFSCWSWKFATAPAFLVTQ